MMATFFSQRQSRQCGRQRRAGLAKPRSAFRFVSLMSLSSLCLCRAVFPHGLAFTHGVE
jgi:hypothetical protein